MRIDGNHNPFSTQCVRPGALPFLGDALRVPELVCRWQRADYIGQIVGPHGAGKSTLTRSMETCVRSEFDVVLRLTIRNGSASRRLSQRLDFDISRPGSQSRQFPTARRLYIIDGLERINWLNRWLLVQNCKSLGFGLLVTSHRKLHRIPMLAEISPSTDTLHQVVDYLLDQNPLPARILHRFDLRTIDIAYQQSGGNLRESLMLLYDEFEKLRRRSSVEVGSDSQPIRMEQPKSRQRSYT